jgi:hypothetical protein
LSKTAVLLRHSDHFKFRESCATTVVNDTGGKFFAGVNNAGSHLATGVVETGVAPLVAGVFANYLKNIQNGA